MQETATVERLVHTHTRRVKTITPASFSPIRSLAEILRLWEYKDLLYTLSAHRVKVRYKQSLLGIAWAILQPLSLMLIYTVVFQVLTRVPTGSTPYPVLAYSGLLLWSFFSTALTTSTNGLVSHAHLVTKVYFPREIIPLTYVIASLFDVALAAVLLASLMVYYHVPVTINVLFAVPIILVLASFVTSMALVFSALQVRFRDIGVGMPLLLQLWMFATPVVYPLSIVPQRYQNIYALNPMVGIVESFRRATIEGRPPDAKMMFISIAISLVLLPLSYIYFKRVEATVADII